MPSIIKEVEVSLDQLNKKCVQIKKLISDVKLYFQLDARDEKVHTSAVKSIKNRVQRLDEFYQKYEGNLSRDIISYIDRSTQRELRLLSTIEFLLLLQIKD